MQFGHALAGVTLAVALSCSAFQEDTDPPAELVEANVKNTDLSVVLSVLAVDKLKADDAYSTWQIRAEVDQVVKGDSTTGATLEYRRTTEGDRSPVVVGSKYLVSFSRSDGSLRIPDVGYHFDYSPGLEKIVRARLQVR